MATAPLPGTPPAFAFATGCVRDNTKSNFTVEDFAILSKVNTLIYNNPDRVEDNDLLEWLVGREPKLKIVEGWFVNKHHIWLVTPSRAILDPRPPATLTNGALLADAKDDTIRLLYRSRSSCNTCNSTNVTAFKMQDERIFFSCGDCFNRFYSMPLVDIDN